MPRKKNGRQYLTVEFTDEEYAQIRAIASKSHKSMAAVVRDFTTQGLNGTVTENNIEFLSPVIREQVKGVIEPMMERMIALTAKSCIQSGTAAYLSADAILKFVQPSQRTEVQESYEAARKKSIAYMKSRVDIDE